MSILRMEQKCRLNYESTRKCVVSNQSEMIFHWTDYSNTESNWFLCFSAFCTSLFFVLPYWAYQRPKVKFLAVYLSYQVLAVTYLNKLEKWQLEFDWLLEATPPIFLSSNLVHPKLILYLDSCWWAKSPSGYLWGAHCNITPFEIPAKCTNHRESQASL